MIEVNRIHLKPREYNATPLPCFLYIKKQDYQQSEYSQSTKRDNISSQVGRKCGSVQQSVIQDRAEVQGLDIRCTVAKSRSLYRS